MSTSAVMTKGGAKVARQKPNRARVQKLAIDGGAPAVRDELPHWPAFNEPAIKPPSTVRASPFPFNTPALAITGRRIGNAWLIVQSAGTIQQRLAVLDQLSTCIHLNGPACAAP